MNVTIKDLKIDYKKMKCDNNLFAMIPALNF